MPKNIHIWNKFGDTGMLPKRWLYFAETKQDDTEATTETPEKEDLGKVKIEERLGLRPKEASKEIDNLTKVDQGEFKSIIDNWNRRAVWNVGATPFRALATLGFDATNSTNEQHVRKLLTNVAKAEAWQDADKFFEGDAVGAYANSTITIMGYRINACDRVKESSTEELKELREKQKIIKRATSGISWTGLKNYVGFPLSDNLTGRISRLERFQETVATVRTESEEKLQVKEKKQATIQQWDQDINALVFPYLDEKERGMFEELVRDCVLGDETESEFQSTLNEIGFKTKTEKITVQKLFSQLRGGNYKKFATFSSGEGRITDAIGGIHTADTQNYFRRKLIQVGKINEDNDIKSRVNFIQSKVMPGHKIKIGNKEMTVVQKDKEGVMLRGSRGMFYINITDPSNPIMTVQSGSKKNPTFSQTKLTINEGSTYTGGVEFALGEAVSIKEEAAKQEEPEVQEKKKTTRKARVVNRFSQVKGMMDELKGELTEEQMNDLLEQLAEMEPNAAAAAAGN